jgi:hypothetical protein
MSGAWIAGGLRASHLRGYLVIAPLLLLIKAIQLGTS